MILFRSGWGPTRGSLVLGRRGAAAALALVLGLAGCATRVPGPESGVAAEVLSGRLAVRIEPAGPGTKPRASNANFELTGAPSAGELRLSSPLGTLVAVARWQEGRAILEAEGQIREFADLDELTREMLGESLPVAALFDWLRARPWPGAPSVPLSGGQPGFEQLGWQVGLDQAAEGLIVATRPQSPAVTVRAKIDPS